MKCFHCDGGLQNWEPNDVPFEEHAKYFPECSFLIITKSSAYVSRFHNGRITHNHTSNIIKLFKSVIDAPSSHKKEHCSEHAGGESKNVFRQMLDKMLRRRGRCIKSDQLCKICDEKTLEIVFYPADILLHVKAALYILLNVQYAELI